MSVRKREWTTASGEAKSAWVVNYTDASGKRRLKTFARKKDADGFAASTHIGVREGTHTPDSVSVTVAQAASQWIAHCEAEGLERGTIKQRNEHLQLHIRPFIGEVKLSALTAPRVQQWLDELRDAGRSLSMRQKVLTNLKTIVSYAQSRGMVAQNVARGIRLRQSKRDLGHEMRAGFEMPTKAELRTMIDKAPARWRPFIVTATSPECAPVSFAV
jgi:integrase